MLPVQAYHYFYPKTFIKYALTEDHVFITRTFSKLFSRAGCRLGYVVGWSDGVKMVQKMCTPHNTNAFAMMFAEKVLTTPGVLDSLIEKFNGGRKYLVDSLDKNGYRHKGEAGNFIFIEPKTDAQTVVDRMKAEKKILIKADSDECNKQERKRKNASDYNIYRNRGKWICLCRKCK